MRKRVRETAALASVASLGAAVACAAGALAAAWRGGDLALWAVTGIVALCASALADAVGGLAGGGGGRG